MQRKELKTLEKYAIQTVHEKLQKAQTDANKIMFEILKAHGIPQEEVKLWRFAGNFTFLEKMTKN